MPNTYMELDSLKERIIEEIINVSETDDYVLDLSKMSLNIDYEIVIKIKSVELYKEE